jgi:transposase
MSLTHTAELNHVDPFDYLVQLQRHANDLQADPASWLPWNYRDTLAVCSSGADPPD